MEKLLNEPPLAIIVPVHNCLNYTLGFLKTCTPLLDYRIIVIDNGSTDGTKKHFREFEKRENIKYIRFNENIGVSAAWNYGITIAQIEYKSEMYLICNNDTLVYKGTIEKLNHEIQNQAYDMLTGTNISGHVDQFTNQKPVRIETAKEITENPDFSFFIIKKSTYEKVGKFDERYYPAYFEDNDYHYRMRLLGLKAYKLRDAPFFHYGSRTIKSSEIMQEKSNAGYVVNRQYYIEKWGGIPGEEKYKTPYNKKGNGTN
jgi:GT2 family glycosyltransferase